jgi:class 3 adenylate cyclase/tetratricopeptide (TPR) repeat protein
VKIKHVITSLVFLALYLPAFGQDSKIDSLKNLIKSSKNDSTKVNRLIEIGTYYKDQSKAEDAIEYGNGARDLASTINYEKGLGYAYNLLGLAYQTLGNYPEAVIQFEDASSVFQRINNQVGVANVLSNLGTVYDDMGDITKSIEYLLQALRVAEEINEKQRIAGALVNLGAAYAAKEPAGDRGLEYFLRALSIFEELNDLMGVYTSTANIGTIYFNRHLYDSAEIFFTDFIKMAEGSADASYGLRYLGEIYAEKGDFDRALTYHNQAIEIATQSGVKQYQADGLLSKASTLRKQGDTKSAISSYNEALEILKELNSRKEIKIAYESLADVYAQIGDYKNAYTFESLLTQIKDTLYNTDDDKKIQQLQFNFDLEKKNAQIDLQEADNERLRIMNWAAGITGFLILLMAVGLFNRYKYVKRTNKIIESERDRSKKLLLNILPEETAKELETKGHAKTRYYESVTVLFTDFKGFSAIAGKLKPQELVAELNDYFMEFDDIMSKYGLEKIKTIGDAYMCAGGIPVTNTTHPLDAVKAALAMQKYMVKKNKELQESGAQGWELRVGIHTGPIVAGVVGKKKYAYDIWGDTVNVASRMESNGEPGRVNISAATFELIKDHYECQHRGKIYAKNIGDIDMYFIEKELEPVAV